jgi:hypothetical protein
MHIAEVDPHRNVATSLQMKFKKEAWNNGAGVATSAHCYCDR